MVGFRLRRAIELVCHTLEMPREGSATQVVLGRQGRLVIPAPMRREMKLAEGDRLSLVRDGDQIVLTPQRNEVKAVLGMLSHLGNGHEVDDLIAERRVEAAREP